MPRDGIPRARRKKYLGPEADFYDISKGKKIRIEFNTTLPMEAVTVRLDWVDWFTIGVRDLETGKKVTLSKGSFHSIERCEDDGLDEYPREGLQKPKQKKYRGPESVFYRACQDKLVHIVFDTIPHREPITARLDWADRFTIGVHDETTGRKTMLFKKGIHSIERDGTNGSTDSSGQL